MVLMQTPMLMPMSTTTPPTLAITTRTQGAQGQIDTTVIIQETKQTTHLFQS